MTDTIFQATDLAKSRTAFLDAARRGSARLRDKDGTSYVMVRESKLAVLESLVEWGSAHIRLEELLRRETDPTVSDLGDLAWLRVFDRDELGQFAADLEESLVASQADGDIGALERCIDDWRITAHQLSDPLRRSVLLGQLDVEADGIAAERFA